MKSLRFPTHLAVLLAALPAAALAAPPQYTPEFLGSFVGTRINAAGEILGSTTVAGAARALVARSGQPYELLPLPVGMNSSIAVDLNDLGVAVGAVSTFSSPDFGGQAVRWTPDGTGGYTIDLLGALPGKSISRATAVNNLGDVVGYSSDGTFRYATWFNGPSGVTDLSPTGVFDPQDINDQRVLVDQSFTVNRLDLGTMTPQNLGVPGPNPWGTNYLATRSATINESGQVVGAAILTTSTSCDREPARYTDGVGWEVYSICGPNNVATDLNDLGDFTMAVNLVGYVRFEGEGTFVTQDLIVNTVGQWFTWSNSAGWINNSRQIVLQASNPTTGESGALLLTPDAPTASPLAVTPGTLTLTAAPSPFRAGTTIRFDLPSASRVTLTVHDVAGRAVRRLLEGEARPAGQGLVPWNGEDDAGHAVAAGVYFVRLSAPDGATLRRVVRLQ